MFFFSVVLLIKKGEQTTTQSETIPTFVKKLYKTMRNYKTLCLKLVRVPAPHKEDKLFVESRPFVVLYMTRAILSSQLAPRLE
jgi:hypothetical protein